MKMALASENDIDAAGQLLGLLDTLSRGYYPKTADEEGRDDMPLHFDEDNPDHLRAFYDQVMATLENAPGYAGRVIGGMCYVLLYSANEIVDLEADTLELHPKLKAALQDTRRLEYLMRHLPGDVTRTLLGSLAHTGDLAEFRAQIDTAEEQSQTGDTSTTQEA